MSQLPPAFDDSWPREPDFDSASTVWSRATQPQVAALAPSQRTRRGRLAIILIAVGGLLLLVTLALALSWFGASKGQQSVVPASTGTTSLGAAATTMLTPTLAPSPTTAATATLRPTNTATPPNSGNSAQFQLVFDEEFSGSSLDTNRWQTYWGHPGGNRGSFWNPNTCHLQNGVLQLAVVAKSQDGVPFTSCGLSTAKSQMQTYGKYEFRARIDAGHDWGGVGLLWPNAPHWPPEIDDCEYGTDTRNDCVVSLHYDADNKWQGTHVGGDYTQWHTYTIIWLPNDLRFLIDGQQIFATTHNVPSEPMWFALQVEANADATQLGSYWVDWVHISRWVQS